MKNFYEAQLLNDLEDHIKDGLIVLENEQRYVDLLPTIYPFVGSKINWALIPNSIIASEYDREKELEAFTLFFQFIMEKFNLEGDAVYFGDGSTRSAYKGDMKVIREDLIYFLRMPQHHYFLHHNLAWCMSFTFEGDMAFGFAEGNHEGVVRTSNKNDD